MSKAEIAFKSGYASLIGRPNVGKSTLLNRLVAQKIAAMSAKPQTTRNKITGVVHLPGGQIVLVDTPGIHESTVKLNRAMVKASFSTYNDVDLILFLIDASKGFSAEDEYVLQSMRGVGTAKILILNKIDLLDADGREEISRAASAAIGCDARIMVCARTGEGLNRLAGAIEAQLNRNFTAAHFTIDASAGEAINWFYENCEVVNRREPRAGSIEFELRVPPAKRDQLQARIAASQPPG